MGREGWKWKREMKELDEKEKEDEKGRVAKDKKKRVKRRRSREILELSIYWVAKLGKPESVSRETFVLKYLVN